MAHPPPTGSEAFRWLDANMVASGEAPDEAFDWVFMLRADDWPLLESIWPKRSAEWREACAYIVGEGPVPSSQRLLRLALADANENVATQAAVSLCAQMLEHPDEAPFDTALLPRLKELRTRDPRGHMEEVDEILRRYGEAG
jgi:hypothetical protein